MLVAMSANAPDNNDGAANRDGDIAGRIAQAREALGLTTAQLARRIGVKTRTLYAWESGSSTPRANRLTMMAGIFGVSALWLLTGVGESPEPGASDSRVEILRGDLAGLRRQAMALVERIDAIAITVDSGSFSPKG